MVTRRSRGRGSKLGVFKSHFEKDVALLLFKIGVEFTYESDLIDYVVEHTYNPDFKIGDIYIETKGLFTAEDRRKHLCIKRQNPDIDVRFIFQRDNRITRKSNTRYSDWCEKHGFLYHIGVGIPEKWLKDAHKRKRTKSKKKTAPDPRRKRAAVKVKD